jgi:hypothetical protein
MSDPQVVYIRWFDASFQASDLTADEMNVRCEIENVGFLVRDADGYVSMAMGRYRPGDQWRYIQHIPKVNILEMRSCGFVGPQTIRCTACNICVASDAPAFKGKPYCGDHFKEVAKDYL